MSIVSKTKMMISKVLRNRRVNSYSKKMVNDIYSFCKSASILRNPENCRDYYQGKYTLRECSDVIGWLFDNNEMGAYCLCQGDPQKKMQEWILNHIPGITNDSYILEVGPGNSPLFDENEFNNWYACDFNYEDGKIVFSGKTWGENKYKKIVKGSWENLVETCKQLGYQGKFDLICGSHSFEHNHRPIKALKESTSLLNKGGALVLFVPDGYSTWEGSYDKTHTLYMTKEMVEDFFSVVEGFESVECEMFRTNMDLVISARKKG